MKPLPIVLLLLLPGILVPAQTPFHPPRVSYRLALTFDDGPRPVGTERLQRVLSKHQVRATFFLVGHMAQRHPDLVKVLVDAGHELGSHSWSHTSVRNMRPADFKLELDLTRLCLQRITGRDFRYFRPPGGTEKYLRKKFVPPAGYQLVMWDVHGLDHDGRSAEEIGRRIEEQVGDGDVVLLHNNLQTTAEALDLVIPHLKARGFKFVTLSELAAS